MTGCTLINSRKLSKKIRLREQYEQGNYPAVIRYIDDHIMNQPNEYYTWDKLRHSIGSDRRITAREMLDKIFGVLPFFKSKKELVEDEFEGYALSARSSVRKVC